MALSRIDLHLPVVKGAIEELDSLDVVFSKVTSQVVMLPHPHARKLPLILPGVVVVKKLVVGVSGPVPEQLGDVSQITQGDIQYE